MFVVHPAACGCTQISVYNIYYIYIIHTHTHTHTGTQYCVACSGRVFPTCTIRIYVVVNLKYMLQY